MSANAARWRKTRVFLVPSRKRRGISDRYMRKFFRSRVITRDRNYS